MPEPDERALKIAIVGPCAAGKTTLALRLKSLGYNARQIVQEHSYVPAMWQIISQPDLLIFLDASFEACTARKSLNWTRREYDEQRRRLGHARQNCDIYLDTTSLNEDQVFDEVQQALGGGQPQPDGV